MEADAHEHLSMQAAAHVPGKDVERYGAEAHCTLKAIEGERTAYSSLRLRAQAPLPAACGPKRLPIADAPTAARRATMWSAALALGTCTPSTDMRSIRPSAPVANRCSNKRGEENFLRFLLIPNTSTSQFLLIDHPQ